MSDERSPYERAREHYRRFYADKPLPDLQGYARRLEAARQGFEQVRRAAAGRDQNKMHIHLWAVGHAVELEAAIRRLKGEP